MPLSTKLVYAAIFLVSANLVHAKADKGGTGNVARGKTLYQSRCAACHSFEYNGVGPAHRRLLGRKAGSVPGYSYSNALKASAVVWTEATLSKWLSNPEKFIPGQKMGVSVPDARDRADLVAYLAAETRQPRQ